MRSCEVSRTIDQWGGENMAETGKDEKRTGTSDRRVSQMDPRQFIDIGGTLESERRNAPEDRREGPEDRRGNETRT